MIEEQLNKNIKTIEITNNNNQESQLNVEKNNLIVDDLFEKLQNQFNDSQLILKTLQNNLKILHKEVLKERKEMNKQILKSKKNKKKRSTLSGFAVPSQISKELSEFLELENENVKISRTDVTSRIIKYIKDNQLQDTDNKKIIIPDEKIKNLFGEHLKENDILQFFNLQSYLKYHFISNKKV